MCRKSKSANQSPLPIQVTIQTRHYFVFKRNNDKKLPPFSVKRVASITGSRKTNNIYVGGKRRELLHNMQVIRYQENTKAKNIKLLIKN